MKRAKAILAISLAAAMMFSVAGCGGAPADQTSQQEQTSQPQEGQEGNDAAGDTGDTKEMQVGQDAAGSEGGAVTEKPEGIQPGTEFTYWTNTDYPSHLPWMDNAAAQLQYNLYDNLLYRYHADSSDVRGNIAESWEVSDDGLVWVFKIKDNVTFTNGHKVNAEAFVKTWDAAKAYQPRYFNVVDKYEATGELELTVTLKAASPTFIYELPMQPGVGVVDPALLEEYGPEDNRAAVGCGPYYLDEYVSGERIVLKANPNYHNPDRAPSIETCKLEVIPDMNTALMGLMSGQLDCMNTADMEIVSSLIDSGWEPIAYPARVHPWWFNAREVEIFKDPVVREALCHMIDWDAVNDLVYNGRYIKLESYWAGPGEVPYGDGYKYDPELGVKMLEDAGYSKDDIAFTIEVNPDFVSQITAVIAQFTELGFTKIEMETYDMSTCLGMIKNGTYHMTTTHNGYSEENPLTPYDMGLIPEGTQRIIWMDQMDEKAQAAYNEALEHREAALKCSNFDDFVVEVEAITKLCQDNYCALGGLQRVGFYGVNPDFSGVYIGTGTGYLEFCYLYSNVE